jgi:uncharacterized protein
MIRRNLEAVVRRAAQHYPVVTVTGPRQSGKTTLCRAVFAKKPYVSLEAPDERMLAEQDPRGFLARFPAGAVLDEIQRAPDLLSYLQVLVDEAPTPGRFVLTGSQHLGLVHQVSQSLAGRAALRYLLPLETDEARRFPGDLGDLDHVLVRGGYPRIWQEHLPATEWLRDYAATYVERDVRQLLNVGDLATFQRFLGLCAGRSGQLLNLSALGADAGVTHNTARAWLSVLEASFIVFRVAPFHRNLGQRLVKTPKLYFWDTGLLCYLLGIRAPAQVATHPLRGAIFETFCVSEVCKARFHRGLAPDVWFFRTHKGREIDLIIEGAAGPVLVEIKAGRTLAADFFDGFDAAALEPVLGQARRVLVYGGSAAHQHRGVAVVPWDRVGSVAGS